MDSTRPWKTAPSAAIPTATPTWRKVLLIAAPVAAFAAGTTPIAASETVGLTRPIGAHEEHPGEGAVHSEVGVQATATKAGSRHPEADADQRRSGTRSESLAASGEKTKAMAVIGSSRVPPRARRGRGRSGGRGRRRGIEKTEAATAKDAIEAPVKAGTRKSRRSSIGLCERSSIAAKAASSAAPPARLPTISRLDQPSPLPRRTPKMSRKSALEKVTSPAQSRRPGLGSRASRSFVRQRDRQQTDRHVDEEDPLPAEGVDEHAGERAHGDPDADARSPDPERGLALAEARTPARSGRGTVPNIAAPPIPCRPRAMLSVSASVANPAKSEAAVNAASPTVKTSLRPSRSASDPAISVSAARART